MTNAPSTSSNDANVDPLAGSAFRLFWDGYGLSNAQTGVGRYARALLEAWPREQGGEAPQPCIVMPRKFADLAAAQIEQPQLGAGFAAYKPIWPLVSFRAARAQIASQTNKRGPWIYHGLSNINLPLIGLKPSDCKFVLTVHDLIPLLAPQSVSRAYAWQFARMLPRAVARADSVVCVSRWTERCLIDRIPAAAGKTTVIRNGRDQITPSPRQWQPDQPLNLLSVARGESYKNLELLPNILKAGDSSWHLSIVTDARGAALVDQARLRAGLAEDRLRILIGADRAQVTQAYQDCHVYVHPSLFEGFGLPLAEALSHGRPVVYVAGSGTDDVGAGPAGFAVGRSLVVEEFVEQIRAAAKLASEPETALKRLTEHRESLPTWAVAAQQLKSLYNELLGT